MFSRLFPKQIDNTYQGYAVAIWLFVPLVLLKLMMGFNVSGLNPWVDNRYIAQSADGFPLDTYGAETAFVVMFLFASWGLSLLVLSLLGVVVLIRYRAMIPLMYLLLSIEQFGRKAIATVSPIIRAAESDGIPTAVLINWGLMAALGIGFVLSLAAPAKRMRESAT